jgi:hypothetical protein
MNREQLRSRVVDGIDRILNHPFLIPIAQSDREVLMGQRQFWLSDSGTSLDRVLGYMGESKMPPKAAFDPSAVVSLLQAASELAPAVVAFLEKLIAALKPTPAPTPTPVQSEAAIDDPAHP